MANTIFQVRRILKNFPMGEKKGSGQEFFAAKARIAALFMERELGIPMEEIEQKLCKAMGIEALSMRSAEQVLGIRTGATMDFSTCQLAIENNQEYFKILESLVKAL